MRGLYTIGMAICLLLGVVACADFDRKFDQFLFGSDENIRAVEKKIAENRKRDELKKQEDLEDSLFDFICEERRKRWLPCDHRNWEIQSQARAYAAEVTKRCADLPPQASLYELDDNALGVLLRDGRPGDVLFMCRMRNPRAVRDAWAADSRTRDILWDVDMRTFGVAVHRSGDDSYSWVLLDK